MVGKRGVVRGVVQARDNIASTIDQKPCVYYSTVVEEWAEPTFAGLGSGGLWHIKNRDEAIVEFYLKDEMGELLLVSPAPAKVIPKPGHKGHTLESDFPKSRFTEFIIQEGDMVEIEGMVTRIVDPFLNHKGYRQTNEIVTLVAPEKEPLIIRCL